MPHHLAVGGVRAQKLSDEVLADQLDKLGAQPSPIGHEDRDARVGLDPLRAVFQLREAQTVGKQQRQQCLARAARGYSSAGRLV